MGPFDGTFFSAYLNPLKAFPWMERWHLLLRKSYLILCRGTALVHVSYSSYDPFIGCSGSLFDDGHYCT